MSDTSNADAGNQQKQQDNQQQNNQQQAKQNNNGNNGETFDNLWDPPETKPDDKTQNNQQQNNQQQNQNVDASKQLDEYVAKLNFADGIDMNTLKNDLAEGKLDSFSKSLNQVGVNAYKRAIFDSHKMITESVNRAVAEAVNKSRGAMGADMAIREMERVIPGTKDKLISPIAQAALKQFIAKGQDPETAVQNVGKVLNIVGTKFGGGTQKQNQRSQGFNKPINNGSNSGADGDDAGEIDFMEILGGGQS